MLGSRIALRDNHWQEYEQSKTVSFLGLMPSRFDGYAQNSVLSSWGGLHPLGEKHLQTVEPPGIEMLIGLGKVMLLLCWI